MPKKTRTEEPGAQIARFRAKVDRMIAAGELHPTAADEALDALVRRNNIPKAVSEEKS